MFKRLMAAALLAMLGIAEASASDLEQGLANASLLQDDVRLPNDEGHALYASVLTGYLDRALC